MPGGVWNKIKMKGILIIIFLVGIIPYALAKRMAPKEVPIITHEEIEYSAPHFTYLFSNEMKHNGGYLLAKDAKTRNKMWLKEIYEIKINPFLERDVQEIFITEIKILDGKLQIKDQKERTFIVDPKTGDKI